MSFLANDRIHAALDDHILLAFVSGIKPEVLPLVLLISERLNDIGVMHAGSCGVVFLDEFCLLVGLDVVLVAIVILTALLRPAGIDVLVAALVSLALLLLLGVAILWLPKTAAVALFSSRTGRNISKSTSEESRSRGLPIWERASIVNSS